jgi:hypothetical protein
MAKGLNLGQKALFGPLAPARDGDRRGRSQPRTVTVTATNTAHT